MNRLKELLHCYRFPIILSIVITLVIWPISFHLFSPKWDNIDCFLPYRYFLSSYINQGEWPWWNPFQSLGYPGYADLQSGAWNPITWTMIGLFGDYTIHALSTELTLYFLLGGLGMYKFSICISKDSYIRMFCGFSFALCGFMVGTTQIMVFLIGIVWLPWILHAIRALAHETKLKHACYLGLYIALETTSASPAFTIILIYILLGAVVFYTLKSGKQKLKVFRLYCFAGLIAILLCLPLVSSFNDFSPYFGRVGKLEYLPWVYAGSFDFAEYISLIFPMTILSKGDVWGATDLTLRNGYFGLFGLILSVYALVKCWKLKNTKILAVLGLVALLLAAGDYTPVFKMAYNLPGFGRFRHPSFFRSYFIFFMILLSGIGLNEIKHKQHAFSSWIIVVLIITFGILLSVYSNSIGFVTDLLSDLLTFKEKPDYFAEPFLFINSIIVILLLLTYLLLSKKVKNKLQLILYLGVFDLVLQTQITAATTMVFPQKTTEQFSEFYDLLPSEIDQDPTEKPLKDFNGYRKGCDPYPIWRNVGTFTKQISLNGHNPTMMSSFNVLEKNGGLNNIGLNPVFFASKHIVDSAQLATQPNTVWGTSISNDEIRLDQKKIEHNGFFMEVTNPSKDTGLIVINQNFHHLWQATLNKNSTEIKRVNDGLMGIEIPPQTNARVQMIYDAPTTRLCFWFSVVSYLILFLYLIQNILYPNKPQLKKSA